ncbi:glycosyltransferase family 2 protein [Nocardioides bruguierae]|uniref:Glycosyltransferase family 2 protein n=1 Tax=Nocardioides bruguierae TaxID=2945102 RepID=A0A9X2D4X7_9ACTN|nr:glycosyltransferase family 2 protein [Nocardioides bruguierae]MCM0619393.1 glycosyltransferase family 2 protein [Nocardioides bruguierae]
MTSTPVTRRDGQESVAVVVVTYNRADLLARMLEGLEASERRPDLVLVVDNASTDHTAEVLARPWSLPLKVHTTPENLGGSGGFHVGTREALAAGVDRVWLVDDDVVPAPSCLGVLMDLDEDALFSVREDLTGALCEKAAVRFDLTHPWVMKPKTASVETAYGHRSTMPALVELENVAFEGLLLRRRVLEAVGLPDPSFFIFYDDVDLAIRIRRAGFRILAVRDAVLVRQLGFDQQHDLSGWKGFYMYRNLFVVHFRYGENALVRAKPYLLAALVVLLSPVRGGLGEARNVLRALASARGMRPLPPSSVD